MTGVLHWQCGEDSNIARPENTLTPEEALAKLKCGNETFFKSECLTIKVERARDPRCAKGQDPIAVIVSCSDSRVPPELVFSKGLGELFVIRSAGNTIDAAAMGSLEYAVDVLDTPLVVVMGHQCCGAVSAAFKAWQCGEEYPGSMRAFVEPIVPAVIAAHKHGASNIEDASIGTNVARIVKRLRTTSEPLLADRIKCGKLRIVGARYNFDRRVDFFDEGPVVASCPPEASKPAA